MSENKTDNNSHPNSGLIITSQGLRGKQSVRATFKLPEHIIKLLGGVATQLGVKQKSLFDQLVNLCRGNTITLKAIIERGRPMEEFCEGQNKRAK